jgi:uncharacterized membrane protein YgaE (UPF0421/DUF939 family)
MDPSAFVGVIGGILVCVLTLLVKMVDDQRKDIGKIKDSLAKKVESEKWDEEKKEIALKLDRHGERLLKIEMRVKIVNRDGTEGEI